MIDIGQTILEQMDLVTSLEDVLASVSYTVFCGDSADIDVCSVEKFKYLSERLSRIVDAIKTRVLLCTLVASLVKDQFFDCVGLKLLVYLSSMSAGYAVCRPYASVLLE